MAPRSPIGLAMALALALAACVSNAFGQPPGALDAIAGVREHSGRVLVKLKSEVAFQRELRDQDLGRIVHELLRAEALERIELMAGRPLLVADTWVIDAPNGDVAGLVRDLREHPAYSFVEPDWIVYPIAEPDDPLLPSQWQHDAIASRGAWDVTTGLPVIIFAACDTGVDLDHPDLAGALVPGVNTAVSGPPQPQAEGGDVGDIHGHGTFVGGCMAAIGNNGVGVTGVGWNLSLMPVRVSNLSSGNASLSNITEGAIWAVQHGAKVANCSYTGVDSSIVQSAGETIRQAGGLLFWAAGNDSRDLSGFDHPDVIVVGSTTSSDTKSGFSAYGLGVDVYAPGSSVYSTRNGGGYGGGSGTSFATPIAAGAAALIWSVDPALTPQQVEQALFQGCDDLGDPGEDVYWGHGRVNVANSMAFVAPPAAPPGPFDIVTPTDGSVGGGSMPLFEWSASSEAGWYTLVVDDDPGMASPLIDRVAFSTSYQPPFQTMAYDTTYWVELLAHNQLGSTPAASGVVSFSTGPLPLPAAFDLLEPADGATDVIPWATVRWSESDETTAYRVILDDDADLSSPLIDDEVPWTQTSYYTGGILEYERAYFWSVEAMNDAGVGVSTPAIAMFTTEPSPPPGGFSMLTPAQDATNVLTGPALEWTNAWLAERYRVEVSESEDFATLVHSAEFDNPAGQQDWKVTHMIPPGTLAPYVAHAWRVTAFGRGGETAACVEGREGGGTGGDGTCDEIGRFVTGPADRCAGDVTGDEVTDVFDFAELASNFGMQAATREQGDLSGDGSIDVSDFAMLAVDFGCD